MKHIASIYRFVIGVFKSFMLARSNRKEKIVVSNQLSEIFLTSKEKYEIIGWGNKKKQRFNMLVYNGDTVAEAYKKIINYRKDK